MDKNKKLLSPESVKALIFVGIVSITAVLIKLFQVTIFTWNLLFINILLAVFGSYALLAMGFVYTFNYVSSDSKIAEGKAALLLAAIITASLTATYFIDPIKADFYIYFIPRQRLISMIERGESIKAGTVKKFVHDGNALMVFFDRSPFVMFGETSTYLVYRSDDKDISISSEEYQKNRDKLPPFPPSPGGKPGFREIKKIQDHWFWQNEGY